MKSAASKNLALVFSVIYNEGKSDGRDSHSSDHHKLGTWYGMLTLENTCANLQEEADESGRRSLSWCISHENFSSSTSCGNEVNSRTTTSSPLQGGFSGVRRMSTLRVNPSRSPHMFRSNERFGPAQSTSSTSIPFSAHQESLNSSCKPSLRNSMAKPSECQPDKCSLDSQPNSERENERRLRRTQRCEHVFNTVICSLNKRSLSEHHQQQHHLPPTGQQQPPLASKSGSIRRREGSNATQKGAKVFLNPIEKSVR